jgi:hypothetical protein
LEDALKSVGLTAAPPFARKKKKTFDWHKTGAKMSLLMGIDVYLAVGTYRDFKNHTINRLLIGKPEDEDRIPL